MKYTKASHQAILDHMLKWSSCTKCSLCHLRSNVVFYEGILPADVLYLAKSPSPEADHYSVPYPRKTDYFYELLPQPLLRNSTLLGLPVCTTPTWAVTYLVSCGPTDGTLEKSLLQPCWTKVLELATIAKPRLIVSLGKDVFGHVVNNLNSLTAVLGYRPPLITVADPLSFGLSGGKEGASDPILKVQRAKLTIAAAVEKYCV